MFGSVAVLIPCYNEAATVESVVSDFQRALPGARVLVYDNNSTDQTAALARRAGATVVAEARQGKGHVVSSMFEAIRGGALGGDAWLLADGDGTYPAEFAPALLAPILVGRADLVLGTRLVHADARALHPLNRLGNHLFSRAIGAVGHARLSDVLTGYRAFGPALPRAVPLDVAGFEVEAAMTLGALRAGLRVAELPVGYRPRPVGSASKLHPVRDGLRIARTIVGFALED